MQSVYDFMNYSALDHLQASVGIILLRNLRREQVRRWLSQVMALSWLHWFVRYSGRVSKVAEIGAGYSCPTQVVLLWTLHNWVPHLPEAVAAKWGWLSGSFGWLAVHSETHRRRQDGCQIWRSQKILDRKMLQRRLAVHGDLFGL